MMLCGSSTRHQHPITPRYFQTGYFPTTPPPGYYFPLPGNPFDPHRTRPFSQMPDWMRPVMWSH